MASELRKEQVIREFIKQHYEYKRGDRNGIRK
jgi:hypothetical protein